MNAAYRNVIPILLVTVGMAGPLAAQDWAKIEIHTIPLTDNLYVLANAGGNIALSVGEDGALLVDAGFEEMGEKVIAAVKAVNPRPLRLVVNTHWHFDHVGGNEQLVRAGATIIAQENVRKQMSAERYITVIDRRMPPSPAAALPDITFTDALTLHWNGDEVQVRRVPPAHTDGDVIVLFRKANVLHVGDTWFNGMYPFIDVSAGGSLNGMVRALDQALELADEKTKIIPGHGPVANKTELKQYRDMLATVRDRVHALIDQGKSRDEIIAAKPSKEFDGRWGRSWLDPDTWVGLVHDGMTRTRG